MKNWLQKIKIAFFSTIVILQLFAFLAPLQVKAQLIPDVIKIDTKTKTPEALPVYNGGVDKSIQDYLCTPNGKGTDLFDCVDRLYRFGVSFGAIAIVFFIVYAGYIYITGGEASKTKAKQTIYSALTGMAILLGSYVLLSFINPNLVQIKTIQPPIFNAIDLPSCEEIGFAEKCIITSGGSAGQVSTGSGVSGNGDVTAPGYVPANDSCGGDPSKLCKANYPNNRCTAEVVSRCNSSEYSGYFDQGISLFLEKGGKAVPGLNMKVLVKAIATVERGCTKSGATSGAGAAGMMQFIQSSAKRFAPKCGGQVGAWPSWANDNPVIQVCMAAFHLSENSSSCGNDVRNIAAGYNAGPGNCAKNTSSGCKVSSCDGSSPLRKWECACDRAAKNYKETTVYGPAVSGCYYNAFK